MNPAASQRLNTREAASFCGLIHASYPADKRFMLTADMSCKALWRNADVWVTNCDTHPASSGGPILTEYAGTLKIAAIMVGMMGKLANVAVPLANWPAIPLNSECP